MGRETNRQRREKAAASAREKAAASRALQKRADQRRRALTVLSSIVVLAVVGVIIAVIAIHSTKSNSASGNRVAASPAVLSDVTSVSPATLQTVGKGSDATPPKKITDAALTSDGKPEVLFVGAEFCPFCAAERWPLIQALSRFGTFKNLNQISSSSSDTDPNTPTFSFYKSSYTSKYLSFRSVEDETRTKANLESPTKAETALWTKYTGNPPGFPFLDFGGKFVQTSESYDPTVLKGLTQAKIASELNTPTTTIAKDIDGDANTTTAAICTLTNNKPANVCTAPEITAIQTTLNA